MRAVNGLVGPWLANSLILRHIEVFPDFHSPLIDLHWLQELAGEGRSMQRWWLPFLGINEIPAWLTKFEIEQFFRLSPAEISTVKKSTATPA
jgi:hypothetical protein